MTEVLNPEGNAILQNKSSFFSYLQKFFFLFIFFLFNFIGSRANVGINKPSSPLNHSTKPSALFVTVSGNVYHDANGMTDGIVNGTGTNLGGTLYITVYDNTQRLVIANVVVAANGTYSITVLSGDAYYFIVTNQLSTVGATIVPNSSLPLRWFSTGENIGSGAGSDGLPNGSIIVAPSSNLSNVNFGIEEVPITDAKTFPNFNIDYFTSVQSNGNPTIPGYLGIAGNNPAFANYYPTSGILSGSDPEDCPAASSCNIGSKFLISSISSTTKLYYNGVALTSFSSILNFNPALLSIYGQIGQNNISFTYSLFDAANFGSSSPLPTWSLNTYYSLPVLLQSFVAIANDQSVLLNWKVTTDESINYFEIWRSNDQQSWSYLGKVIGEDNLSMIQQYNFTDNNPLNGKNYYQLKIFANNVLTAQSNIVFAEINGNNENYMISPNPASTQMFLSGITNVDQIIIFDINGRKLFSAKTNGEATKLIYVQNFSPGTYFILFLDKNGMPLKRSRFIKINQ